MDFTYNPNQIALLGEDDKLLAEVTFPEIDKDTVNIDHTFVDPSLRGQNLADKLMNAVAEQLCAEDKKAVLTCSYAVKWFFRSLQLDIRRTATSSKSILNTKA